MPRDPDAGWKSAGVYVYLDGDLVAKVEHGAGDYADRCALANQIAEAMEASRVRV